MYDTRQLDELHERVRAGLEPDPTPYGLFHDHCPFCGADWRDVHSEMCESPYHTVRKWDVVTRHWCDVNPNTAWYHPERYLDHAEGGPIDITSYGRVIFRPGAGWIAVYYSPFTGDVDLDYRRSLGGAAGWIRDYHAREQAAAWGKL